MSDSVAMVFTVGAVTGAVLLAPSRTDATRLFGSAQGKRDTDSSPLDVAYALELLALALSSGAPVVGALDAVAGASDRRQVRDVLARVSAALKWGVDENRAWVRAPLVWRPAARAFALTGRAGAAPAEVLRRAAADLRAAEAERVATAGAQAGTRIVLPLGLCFLPAFLLLAVVPLVLGLVDLGAAL